MEILEISDIDYEVFGEMTCPEHAVPFNSTFPYLATPAQFVIGAKEMKWKKSEFR